MQRSHLTSRIMIKCYHPAAIASTLGVAINVEMKIVRTPHHGLQHFCYVMSTYQWFFQCHSFKNTVVAINFID